MRDGCYSKSQQSSWRVPLKLHQVRCFCLCGSEEIHRLRPNDSMSKYVCVFNSRCKRQNQIQICINQRRSHGWSLSRRNHENLKEEFVLRVSEFFSCEKNHFTFIFLWHKFVFVVISSICQHVVSYGISNESILGALMHFMHWNSFRSQKMAFEELQWS